MPFFWYFLVSSAHGAPTFTTSDHVALVGSIDARVTINRECMEGACPSECSVKNCLGHGSPESRHLAQDAVHFGSLLCLLTPACVSQRSTTKARDRVQPTASRSLAAPTRMASRGTDIWSSEKKLFCVGGWRHLETGMGVRTGFFTAGCVGSGRRHIRVRETRQGTAGPRRQAPSGARATHFTRKRSKKNQLVLKFSFITKPT